MEGSVNERLHFGRLDMGEDAGFVLPAATRSTHAVTSLLKNPFDRHELVRQDVKQFVTLSNLLLKFAQTVASKWENISATSANSSMMMLRKNSFTVMIVGSAGSCYAVGLHDNHLCVENSMRHHCPICYEYLFDSLKDVIVMKCGHTMHHECYLEMIKNDKYCCPICSKSVIDMSKTWKRIDEEIEATVMPQDYRNRKVRFGYYVMTAMTQQKFTSTFLAKNVVTADHIIPAQLHLQFFPNDQISWVQEGNTVSRKLKLAPCYYYGGLLN
ncbi:hypothetical protein JHK82_046371 [Glycine max]|nr:hypothetical protein JHK82_046371 [Glycine max]